MPTRSFTITGNLVDIHKKAIYSAEIVVENGVIATIAKIGDGPSSIGKFILPGFVDSHVHVESSMLIH